MREGDRRRPGCDRLGCPTRRGPRARNGGPLSFPGGTATPPNGNVPPRSEDGFGADPHSYPRNDIKGRAQKSAFLSDPGVVLNFCTAGNNVLDSGELPILGGTPTPCYSHGWAGP